MKYAEALTALIDQQYNEHLKIHADLELSEDFRETRDQVAVERENIRIAGWLFGEGGVGNEFYKDPDVDFGVFNNHREYGLTVSIAGWTFCAYEHRNSDAICIEGCWNTKVQEYGPYGGKDKYDVLASAGWREYPKARDLLITAMETVRDNPKISRARLKAVLEKAAKQYNE